MNKTETKNSASKSLAPEDHVEKVLRLVSEKVDALIEQDDLGNVQEDSEGNLYLSKVAIEVILDEVRKQIGKRKINP